MPYSWPDNGPACFSDTPLPPHQPGHPLMTASRQALITFCLRQTIPVACAYIFLGMAYGICMNAAGWHPAWTLLSSLIIYAGSMQFVLVPLLASGASLTTIALMTLFINARHLFYGIGCIETFRHAPRRTYPYLIFALTDETYSLLCTLKIPPELDRQQVFFTISLCNHAYWLLGSLLGALAGHALPLNFTGIDFTMTALFTVIFLEQWQSASHHGPALIGAACSLFFLLWLGPAHFLLPALIVTVAVLMLAGQRLTPPPATDNGDSHA